MPWFMIELDGWRKWLSGFFREKERNKQNLSNAFSFPISTFLCAQLMDAVELALRFMNYDVLCIALHCIEMRCSWPSFVYFILLWVWFIFFLAAVIRAIFFSFRVVFRRILQHWNPHVHCNAHCTFGIQMYIFVLCLSMFSSSPIFKVFFACTQMGFSWSLHSVWPFNS